jgi:hypothetical protein
MTAATPDDIDAGRVPAVAGVEHAVKPPGNPLLLMPFLPFKRVAQGPA